MYIASILLAVSLLTSWGCGTTSDIEKRVAADSAIIVVPGYYGAKLEQSGTGDLVWISGWEALFGKRSLVLPRMDLGIHDGLDLKPHGILREVSLVPGLYSLDVYGPLLSALETFEGGRTRVIPLVYDWRLDLMDVVAQLERTVRELGVQGIKRIALVAHSMGGLGAAYYMRYGGQDPEKAIENWQGAGQVDAVVLTGVPYRGSLAVLRNMQLGRPVGLNSTLLHQEAVASFPSSYYLLPASDDPVFLSVAGETVPIGLYEPRHWKEYGWGLMKRSLELSTEVAASRLAYTTRWLQRSRHFSERLNAPALTPNPTPVPLLAVVGTGKETMSTVVWKGPNSAYGEQVLFERDQVKREAPQFDRHRLVNDGDGTALVTSAQLPDAYRRAFEITDSQVVEEHDDLIHGRTRLTEILSFLGAALAGGGSGARN